MKKFMMLAFALCLVSSVVLIGCASIIGKGGPQNLVIRSAPDQAEFEIYDESGTKVTTGKTPSTVSLEKKKGYFSGKKYTIKITKANYIEKSQVVDTNANGWYIGGNIIFGGLIGWLIVDPLTGAMWSLDTNDLNLTLDPTERKITPDQKSMNDSLNFNVMLLQDVPVAYRYSMVKISD